VSLPRLRWRVNELARSGRPGVRVMRSLIDARSDGGAVPQSVFETRLLRVLRAGGLPEPVHQYEVRAPGRLAVVDFAYPDARLAIEADGYRWHAGRARFDDDRARGNDLTLLGWRVLRITWTQLTHEPEAAIDAVHRALAASTPRA